eukprot:8591419-Pyramimonas_sp.AAC.1
MLSAPKPPDSIVCGAAGPKLYIVLSQNALGVPERGLRAEQLCELYASFPEFAILHVRQELLELLSTSAATTR